MRSLIHFLCVTSKSPVVPSMALLHFFGVLLNLCVALPPSLQRVKSASWHKDGAKAIYCRMNRLYPLRDWSDHTLAITFFCFLVEFSLYHVLRAPMSFYIELHPLHLLSWSHSKSDVFSASSLFRSSCSLWPSSVECGLFCVLLPHLFMSVGVKAFGSCGLACQYVSFSGKDMGVWLQRPVGS